MIATAPILKSQQTDTKDLALLDDGASDKKNVEKEKLQQDFENEKSLSSDLRNENQKLKAQLLLSKQKASNLETSLNESKIILTDKDNEIEKLQNTSTLEREEFEKLKKQMILLEDQLMQTRQLKDQHEDRIEQLTNENENLLKSESEKLPTPFVDGTDEKLVTEISLNSANPLEPSFGEKSDSSFRLEILQQQLEDQHLEMASLETNLKSEVCELQQNVENQERLVSKLEHENKKLIRQSYELNDNILTQQERIEELLNENNHLAALVVVGDKDTSNRSHSLDLMFQNQSRAADETEEVRYLNQEIETLKDQLTTQELENERIVKSSEEESERLEKQIEQLQNNMERKDLTIRELTTECQHLRMLKDKEQATSAEQESYMLCEIERVQSEYKQKAHCVEEDKDNQITLLRKEHEEKLLEMEIEFENRKALELNDVKEDYLAQIESLESQRVELLMALRKLDSMKADNEDKNDLSDHDERKLTKETLHQHDENHINGDILGMLANLEQLLNHKNKQAVNLNKTWPTAETSAFPPTPITDTKNMSLRDQIEKARSDISMQIRDLDKFFPISPTTTQHSLNDTSSSFDEIVFDYADSSPPRPNSSSSHRPNSASTPRSKHTPTTHDRLSSPSLFRDSGIAYDFATTNNRHPPGAFYEKQLRDLLHSFRRFELQCRLVGSTDFSSEKWFVDLRTWRERVNTRLRKIEQYYLGDEHDNDSILKSIVFRPSDLEIREILADVNRKYDRYKTNEA